VKTSRKGVGIVYNGEFKVRDWCGGFASLASGEFKISANDICNHWSVGTNFRF